ncbi:hypothetical protein AAVH_40643, partial [Aphelenchoides avenae]
MATEVFGIALEGEAGRPDFVVYPSLAPKSYACTTATTHCPAGALFSEAQFSAHGHDANGKPCEAPYREPLLRDDATQRQKELFKLTRGSEAGGGVSYMFLKKPQACSKRHPMNMKFYQNAHLDRHEFRLKCAAP